MIQINYHSLFGSKRWKIRQAKFVNSLCIWFKWFPIVVTFHGAKMGENFWRNLYMQTPYNYEEEEQRKDRMHRYRTPPRIDLDIDEVVFPRIIARRNAGSSNTVTTMVGNRVEVQSYTLPEVAVQEVIVKDETPFYRNRLEEVD